MSITSKVNNNDFIVTKDDKGNCLVIMCRTDYIDKIQNFLNGNNKFIILQQNRLNCFIAMTSSYINMCHNLFTEYKKNYNFILSNPIIPRRYALPKLNKERIPIKPVVSFCNFPVSIIVHIKHHKKFD